MILLGAVAAGASETKKSPDEQKAPPREVRVMGQVPAFDLLDQDDNWFSSAHLRGSVWIATFIFTSCRETCPAQLAGFARLQKSIAQNPALERARLISISVYPTFDTPQVLKKHAERYKADPKRWIFLTGNRADIKRLCIHGFKLPVEESDDPNDIITHSQNYILVDAEHRIRGYYDGLDENSIKDLEKDLTIVAAESADRKYWNLQDPEGILDVRWLEDIARDQQESLKLFKVFHDFQFTDMLPESGITFVSQCVDDAGRDFKANHYDHGNGTAVADVDGDGLLDIYFVTQLGTNQLWRNLGNGRFENWTSRGNVGLEDRVGASASFADIDNDGDPDLFATSVRGGNVLFENDGTGEFKDITADSGLGYVGHSSAGIFFDYDRDGLLDLLLVNVGKYTTEKQGRGGYYIGHKAAFRDHLFAKFREQSILYRNLGNRRFKDVSEEANLIEEGWNGDACPLDLNEDGWQDLYIVNMQGHDEYYENQGGKHFVLKGREHFPATPWGSMGIGVFDYNNDGRLDIYVTDMHIDMASSKSFTKYIQGFEKKKLPVRELYSVQYMATDGNHVAGNAFFRNDGNQKFTEVSDTIHAENYWPWGFSVGDLNADGFEDVFIASSMNYGFRYAVNAVLLNNRGERFLDSEFILGVEPRRLRRTATPWFELDCSGADKDHKFCQGREGTVAAWGALGTRSSAIFDLDNDGDLDIVGNDFNSEPIILVSNLSEKKPDFSYLKIRLVGKKSNAGGLGARITLRADKNTYVKVNDGKSGYLSQSLYPVYFGLDGAKHVDQVDILWPSGTKQSLPGPLAVNRQITIVEEQTVVEAE